MRQNTETLAFRPLTRRQNEQMLQIMRKRLLFSLMVFAAAVFATVAQAERRIALVIGNSAYRNASALPNTINDANAIAALFRSVGFEVVSSRNELGVLEFKRAVRDFLITAETADIAVVYYAGHGIEVSGANYLIPVDAKLARDYDVEDEAVALDRIIWALQPVRRLRLILLDACRDNPFVARLQRSVSTRAAPKGGLGKLDDVSADTLVAYAAKEGSVSYDGAGANSPFAAALLKHLTEPGLDIRIALGRVRDDVLRTTAGRQEPFIYGSLGGSIIPLVPSPVAKALEAMSMPNAVAAPPVVLATPAPIGRRARCPCARRAEPEHGIPVAGGAREGGSGIGVHPRRAAAGTAALRSLPRRDCAVRARGRLCAAQAAGSAPVRELRNDPAGSCGSAGRCAPGTSACRRGARGGTTQGRAEARGGEARRAAAARRDAGAAGRRRRAAGRLPA